MRTPTSLPSTLARGSELGIYSHKVHMYVRTCVCVRTYVRMYVHGGSHSGMSRGMSLHAIGIGHM